MSSLQMNNFFEINESKRLEKSQREAKQYLNKITILQQKLDIEEQNLRFPGQDHLKAPNNA